MKKIIKIIVITILAFLSLIVVQLGGYLYYDLFVPDDYGEQYNQTWQSEDGRIEFVVNNAKGFMGHNYEYEGNATINNESINILIGFSLVCGMDTADSQNCIFLGDYYYNPVFNQVKVKITDVDTAYSGEYKVGDELTFVKK